MFVIDFIIFLWDSIYELLFREIDRTFIGLAVVAGTLLFWRISVVCGPLKKCTRCRGDGYRSSLLGGVYECRSCKGKGRIPRIGAGK